MDSILKVFLLAMTPIGELRAAIPVGMGIFHLNWEITYLISVLGNLVPPIFLLLFLDPISQWFSKKSKFFEKIFNWLLEKTRKKYLPKKAKFGYLALIGFVAIPLPFTGAWTGSIIAFLFGIPFKIAFPFIAFGVLIAGAVVLAAFGLGITIEKYFGWQALLGILLIVVFLWLIYKHKTKKRNENEKN